MRKLIPAVAVVLAGAGCSGDPAPAGEPTPAPGSATSAPVESAAPAGSPSAAPSGSGAAQVPLEECLSGRYRLARFVSVGANQTYGTGSGGDIVVRFDDGSYTMTGAGKDPIELTLAGQQAELTVDGTVDGSLTTTGYQADFTVDTSKGSATLRSGGRQETLTMAQIASVLAPNGSAALACGRDQLIMAFEDVRLELERP